MTTMVQFTHPNIAIIGDTADEVMALAEAVIQRRMNGCDEVIVQDCVSLDPEVAERVRRRLAELRQRGRQRMILPPASAEPKAT